RTPAGPMGSPKHSAIPHAAMPTVAREELTPPVSSTSSEATRRAPATSGFLNRVADAGNSPRMHKAAAAIATTRASVESVAGQGWVTIAGACALVWFGTGGSLRRKAGRAALSANRYSDVV